MDRLLLVRNGSGPVVVQTTVSPDASRRDPQQVGQPVRLAALAGRHGTRGQSRHERRSVAGSRREVS